MYVSISPGEPRARAWGQADACVELSDFTALVLTSLADCDALVAAACAAKEIWLGRHVPAPLPAVPDGQAAAVLAESIRTGTPLAVDDDEGLCECGDPQDEHADTVRTPCQRPGCGCTVFRLAAPKAAPEPPRVVPGAVLVPPGYVVGECGHRVARSEWRAGNRTCESCKPASVTASLPGGNSVPLGSAS